MPRFRDYTQATSLEATDAFVIDRESFGTMYVEGPGLARGIGGQSSFPRCLTYVVDGGGSVIPTGVVGDLYLPFAVNVVSATLLADQTGSVVVDIWSAPFASYPPTIDNSITAAALPTISSGVDYQDTTLTGWTTSLPAGNTLRFNVNSASSITRLTIALATG